MKVIIPDPILIFFRSLDKVTRKTIGVEIRKLQDNKPVNMKKLKTEKDKWRIAAGEWRIMLELVRSEKERTYIVSKVVMRKDAYR